jgi:hypothetical protein
MKKRKMYNVKRKTLPKIEIKLPNDIKDEIRSHLVGEDPAAIESFIEDFEYLYEGMQRTAPYRRELTKTVASQLKRDSIKKIKKIEKDLEKLVNDDLKIKGRRYHGPSMVKYLLGVDLVDELVWDLFDHDELLIYMKAVSSDDLFRKYSTTYDLRPRPYHHLPSMAAYFLKEFRSEIENSKMPPGQASVDPFRFVSAIGLLYFVNFKKQISEYKDGKNPGSSASFNVVQTCLKAVGFDHIEDPTRHIKEARRALSRWPFNITPTHKRHN